MSQAAEWLPGDLSITVRSYGDEEDAGRACTQDGCAQVHTPHMHAHRLIFAHMLSRLSGTLKLVKDLICW